MVLLLVVQLMILLSSLAVAKPDCLRTCGNVSIPYPFGIAVGCYLDRWFAIECNSNKPFLRNIKHGNVKLEVLNISPENSTMLVYHPAYKRCENASHTYEESVNIGRSPFFFSQTENVLTGLGCDNFARIYYNGTVAGCYSSCGISEKTTSAKKEEEKETTGCFGTKCCQTKIPLLLQVFYASTIQVSGKNKKECKSAFLVQEKWLTENIWDPNVAKGNFESVPVVLDWGILDSAFNNLSFSEIGHCEIFANSTPANASFANFSRTAWSSSVHKCKCKRGYEGNPYDLSHGCQDTKGLRKKISLFSS